jgi:hypothetical protein
MIKPGNILTDEFDQCDDEELKTIFAAIEKEEKAIQKAKERKRKRTMF